jgi:hypothetical protein
MVKVLENHDYEEIEKRVIEYIKKVTHNLFDARKFLEGI